MTAGKVVVGLGTAALLFGISAGTASAQGRLYAFHTGASGTCPGLDWHVYLGEDNKLSGVIGWNHMQSIAKVSGSVKPDHTFQMEATAGDKKADITGSIQGDGWMVANIKGVPACEGKTIKVPWYQPSPSG
ncbi:MAG: hypothetical protein JO227_16165 [Acetobacteraceae bacterium]|nr:hypothetical protein [Acetobacteraceae bacterium]